ncbi:amidase [Marinobacter sp. M216]|uniref:Amidase n=1 Tax=Marinobacter albus TaxID=3030833 RepID=A0ABT7HBT0_9GAMM|nr:MULTISPECIES: amidase [unclassified Marinobacter]MBW7470390.1 amidase [Marinobacter sp. F4218]MDK9557345.1 amidase [Marinobacter sp. M216]
MDSMHYQPAYALLAELKAGRITSESLVRCFLERIRQYNSNINAAVTLDESRALEQARAADRSLAAGEATGSLHGLPLTLKDTWEVAGMTTTAGAPALHKHLPDYHADVARRLEDAGAIIIGKTNVPIYATDLQSYNKLFGVTNNPYNRDHTPGGSSGGAAAALASGMTPLEVGSDLAGSIRTPGHFCGVFGHKPTRALVSMRGHIPGPPGTQSQPDLAEGGPMARSSRDLELLLKVIAGPSPAEARSWSLSMEPSSLENLEQARVGLWLDDPLCPIEEELSRGYRHLASELEAQGALVAEPKHGLLNLEHILPVYFNLLGSLIGSSIKPHQRRQMKWIARLDTWLKFFGPVTPFIGEYARGVNQAAHQWASWNERREKMRSEIETLFEEFDVLLTPVTPTAAIKHDHSQPVFKRRIMVAGQPRAYMDQFCWIALATVLGLPATSVPIGRTKAGLPFNIQVIGAPGKDLTTIRFGQLLEEAGLAGFRPPKGF